MADAGQNDPGVNIVTQGQNYGWRGQGGQTDEGGTFRPHPYAHPTQAYQAGDHRGR